MPTTMHVSVSATGKADLFAGGQRGKKEAINVVNSNFALGLNERNTKFSNINTNPFVWQFEMNNAKFSTGFHLLLNDQHSPKLHCFYIPGGTINPIQWFRQKNVGLSHVEVDAGSTNFKTISCPTSLLHSTSLCFLPYWSHVMTY
ncbi:MAG: hypothetical protein FWE23_11480 [Chitinivibrionia bacterium]|nr:hypothetical protein [Chitinivibrionia bacterium]